MEARANTLRAMRICRFCLDNKKPLSSIYEKEISEDGKQQTVPLPFQIMACVAIEVLQNDGMPQLICNTCRSNTIQAYSFKSICKKADDALKLFLTTGDTTLLNSNNIRIDEKVIKRKFAHDVDPPQTKKSKTTTSTSLSKHITTFLDDDKDEINMEESIVELEIEQTSQDGTTALSFNETEDVEEEEEEEEDDLDEEEDTTNPVLKVSQVETDVFPCPQCERTFPLKQLLDLHVAIHNRERTFECDKCKRKFFTKYDLAKHYDTHSGSRPYSCVVCKKTFAREAFLHRHEKTHVDVPKYLCAYCDKTFLLRSDLDAHVVKHKKMRPFQCKVCKKRFVFKQGLERHEVTHDEEKPHKCNYCLASFTSPIKLMRHVTSHAGLRPYPCKVCGRTFLLSHHLTRHMRSHYATKEIGQHKCDICSMAFRRKDSLINHSTIHSMVNLRCVICYTTFDNAKEVMNHITTHLSGLPYPCDKCDYSFDTQEQLEEHELKHAEMEYEEQIEKEVSKEAKESKGSGDEKEGDHEREGSNEEESDYEECEYIIGTHGRPEIVRKSKRRIKVKDYAEFLKEELGSDLEDNTISSDQELAEEAEFENKEEEEEEEQSIKPITRIEGTKVYARRNPTEKPKIVEQMKPPQMMFVNSEETNQLNQKITTIGNLGLTKRDVQALPNKQFVDMKIGDKRVRVQKLMMTKAEIEQMAREGKIEMKGDTILLKKSSTSVPSSTTTMVGKPLPFRHIMDTGIDEHTTPQKTSVKKTYIRKAIATLTSNSKIVQADEDG